MVFNQVLTKKVIGTAMKDGATVTLSVATKTSCWIRPDTVVDVVGEVLKKSFGNWRDPLPKGTKEVCSR